MVAATKEPDRLFAFLYKGLENGWTEAVSPTLSGAIPAWLGCLRRPIEANRDGLRQISDSARRVLD